MSKNIYESKVAADAAKRFRMLCEYTFNITEDDGEETPDANMEAPQGDMNASAGGVAPEMGADTNAMGDMGENPNMGDTNAMSDPNMGNPNAMGDMNGGNEQGATGFDPSMGGEEGGNEMGTEPMQPEDEVIDVDELTQSQEETEEKVEDVQVSMTKGFEKILNVVDKLNKMIDASTANMEQIKQEIEKRNPTPMEKLNMRAANDSYPFNVSPSDYWKTKEATSNYRIGGEDEPDAKQYTITQGDIDDITDFQRISKELNDSEFNQNLMNIFGLR